MIEDPPVSASPVDVVADACRRHSATRADLMGPLKTKWLTKARREVATALVAQGMGLKDIGRLLGRDHSTIHYLLGRRKPRKKARRARR